MRPCQVLCTKLKTNSTWKFGPILENFAEKNYHKAPYLSFAVMHESLISARRCTLVQAFCRFPLHCLEGGNYGCLNCPLISDFVTHISYSTTSHFHHAS